MTDRQRSELTTRLYEQIYLRQIKLLTANFPSLTLKEGELLADALSQAAAETAAQVLTEVVGPINTI